MAVNGEAVSTVKLFSVSATAEAKVGWAKFSMNLTTQVHATSMKGAQEMVATMLEVHLRTGFDNPIKFTITGGHSIPEGVQPKRSG